MLKTPTDRRTLQRFRFELNLTQQEVAFACDIHLNRYWRIEHGFIDPTEDEQELIAKALKTTVAEAFPDMVDDDPDAEPAA